MTVNDKQNYWSEMMGIGLQRTLKIKSIHVYETSLN